MKLNLVLPAAIIALAGLAAPAAAEWKPDRPVTLILANNAGGGADFIARLVANKVSEIWGQPVVVENHGGASGRIGIQLLVRAAPDGYTFGMGQNTLTVWPAIYTNMPFDTFNDLDAVTQITEIPLVFSGHPSVPATDLAEFAAYARENPGMLNYSGGGQGSISHLAFSLLEHLADIELVNIPYPGTAQGIAALMAGEVQATLGAPSLVQDAYTSGDLIPLAAISSERLAFIPDTPTVAELGWPELEAVGWNGIFLPAGAPQEVQEAYFAAFTEAMADPAVIAAVENQGQAVVLSESQEAFVEYIDSQIAMHQTMADFAGIEPEDAQR